MENNEIITYEKLYDLLRKEKYSQELQQINPEFFKEVINYLEEKTAILNSQKSKDSIFSSETEKTEKQLKNIKKIVKDIYERRENKIIKLALFSSRINEKDISPSLLPEEKQFFLETLDVLNRFRKEILESVIEKKMPVVKESKPKSIKREESQSESTEETKIVRLTNSLPKFVANDLNIYGPFEEEDTAILPKKTANILIKKKRAEEIKIEKT